MRRKHRLDYEAQISRLKQENMILLDIVSEQITFIECLQASLPVPAGSRRRMERLIKEHYACVEGE